MTAEVIAPIVAASFTGFLFVVFVVYGLFRPGHTMQQLRWVLGMWFLVAQAIAFGAIANVGIARSLYAENGSSLFSGAAGAVIGVVWLVVIGWLVLVPPRMV